VAQPPPAGYIRATRRAWREYVFERGLEGHAKALERLDREPDGVGGAE
jgi:hypothetical protein